MYTLTEMKFNWQTLLRYFHYELQCTVREMEGGIYEKMSTYLGTLARWSCHRHRHRHRQRHHEKMSNSIPIHHQEFLRETVTICQDGVADLLRLGELVQQYQAAGWKDHQVGRSLLTSFTSFTFLSSYHWQLQVNSSLAGSTTTAAIWRVTPVLVITSSELRILRVISKTWKYWEYWKY